MSSSVPALANAVAATERYNSNLVALCERDETVSSPIGAGVTVGRLPFGRPRGLGDFRFYQSARKPFRKAGVIHIHGIWREHSYASGALARKYALPMVVSAHGMLQSWAVRNKGWKKALYAAFVEKQNLASSKCLRALTRAEVSDYRSFGLRNPVVVVPNGITMPVSVGKELFLNTFPQTQNRRIILFLSRVHYKKGPDLLCRAWANIIKSSPRFRDCCLVLAGPDFENTRASLETLVCELRISNSVVFTGMLTGDLKWSALAAADIFTLPSYSEGFSIAVLEAMAMQLPVLISRQCNFEEVAQFGCGMIIEPNTAEIESALSDMLSLPATGLAEMGAKGKALVQARYQWSKIGEQMADVYDWLRGSAKPSSVEIYD